MNCGGGCQMIGLRGDEGRLRPLLPLVKIEIANMLLITENRKCLYHLRWELFPGVSIGLPQVNTK
jgi:hypothetical protein